MLKKISKKDNIIKEQFKIGTDGLNFYHKVASKALAKGLKFKQN